MKHFTFKYTSNMVMIDEDLLKADYDDKQNNDPTFAFDRDNFTYNMYKHRKILK